MQVFSFEYILSVISALLAAYLVASGSPNINAVISYFLIPLLVAYLVIQVINYVFPSLNRWGRNISNYVENRTLNEINETGFMQIFPPILIVSFLFFILLYNRHLG